LRAASVQARSRLQQNYLAGSESDNAQR